MISLREAEQASKKFAEQDFYNQNFMSVGISNSVGMSENKGYELTVYIFKKIRTDNLPQAFEGLRVNYKFHGAPQTR